MLYKYKGLDHKGEGVKGIIEANDFEDAKRRLRVKNIYYTSLKENNHLLPNAALFKRKKSLTHSELSSLSRDLSIYLKAGISIANALKLAQNQYGDHKNMVAFVSSILTFLDEGQSFYQALEAQNIIALPVFYKQSIKVSENSGILQEVLLELSIFIKEQDRVGKQIRGAFAYPGFIIFVSILMVSFMIVVVVPKITGMFEQLHQELPPITQFVISVSDFLVMHWMGIVAILVLGIISFSLLMRLNQRFKYAVDLLVLKIPFFGTIIETSELGRFSYISSVLIRSGVPFVQTVNLSANILKNSVIRTTFSNAAERVVEGSKLSNALNKSSYAIDRAFVQAIALGEETSEVSSILHNLSDLYFENNKDKISVFLSLLEPMLMLLVGGIIGFIVSAMLLPIFSMNIQ